MKAKYKCRCIKDIKDDNPSLYGLVIGKMYDYYIDTNECNYRVVGGKDFHLSGHTSSNLTIQLSEEEFSRYFIDLKDDRELKLSQLT